MFIVGIILIAFIAWWLNGLAYVSADEYFVWEKYRWGVVATGVYLLVGFALISIKMITIRLISEKKQLGYIRKFCPNQCVRKWKER